MSNLGFSIDSEFFCTKCGGRGIPIPRKGNGKREAGHLKKLWCIKCKQETNHAEVKAFTHYDYNDFKFEFDNGNFTETGLRKMPYGEFRDMMHKKGVELP